MGLETRLSLRTTAESSGSAGASSLHPGEAAAPGSRSFRWHLLGIVFVAWAVLAWFEQVPATGDAAPASVPLSELVVGKWSCETATANDEPGVTYLRFGPEGSFERRSDDVGSLFGDYIAGPQWVDVVLTHLPALERYGMDPSINQRMRLTMAEYSQRRLVFDSEVITNGLGTRRWTCARS